MNTKITFYGGAGMVTGSNFLLDDGANRVLIDCGFYQGCSICDEKNRADFSYDPASIDVVFITHAHLDHTGRIPKLVKDGFTGRILSTPPTKDIAKLMLQDSLSVIEEEAEQQGKKAAELPYEAEDIERALALWETIEYHEEVQLKDNLSVMFKDAGHILGSAMVVFSRGKNRFVATGDLGNSPAPLLRDTEPLQETTSLLMESVYGDREHETRDKRRELLEDVIENTAARGGALLIPAFSLERTQEVLYEIERMMDNNRIPLMPVFLDSPLAISITEVYRRHTKYFNKSVLRRASADDELFAFPQLRFTRNVEESKGIWDFPNPKIIIAGSGMSNGGRILHHEKKYLPDKDSTLLIVGYQAPGSLGREIQDGAKLVSIMDSEIPVNARVETIRGYSAHRDAEGLLRFVAHTSDTLRKVFVVMGEPKATTTLAQRIRDYIGVNAKAPMEGDTDEIDL